MCLIKMPSLLIVVAVAVLMLQYNWTLFLPQVNTEKVDLIVHGKMSFLFTTRVCANYVKCYFVNDIHSRPPCLNSNLEETLECSGRFRNHLVNSISETKARNVMVDFKFDALYM